MKKILSFALVVSLLVISGCSAGVVRKDRKNAPDLAGPWSDTDTRFVAEEIVKACTAGTWVRQFNKAKGRDPLVGVGAVTGRIHGHADTVVFVEDLQMALINSGRVKFVMVASGETGMKDARADYMLQGVVSSIVDEARGRHGFLFQADLELIDMTTREKIWTGRKKVNKIAQRPRYSL